MPETKEQVEAGQAVYSKKTLAIYDLYVLGFSNRFVWKCPSKNILDLYNRHISTNHLDIGVGTGYFPDRCKFPVENPRLGLMDLNGNSLGATSERVKRYHPETYRHNVLEPVEQDIPGFDSIGVNYLLHCLPGTIDTKTRIFKHLDKLLNPGGVVFGSTILHSGVKRGVLAKKLMKIYNGKGIFSNTGDDLDGLKTNLETHFTETEVTVIGSVALFACRK
ncbi:MAG: class I SAM-dependent methyltransferase [bacterium]|nr:class I SAM-dependent methyltransferase [bacterium]